MAHTRSYGSYQELWLIPGVMAHTRSYGSYQGLWLIPGVMVIWRCQTPTRALCATAQKESGEVPIPNPYGLQESCSSDTYLVGL